jgi:hypothetical protein
MNKSEAGRLGAKALKKKLGGLRMYRKYLRRIGQKGGDQLHRLYRMHPIGQSQFAFIRRETPKESDPPPDEFPF